MNRCDITKEILYATDFSTPMGDIIIVKALSDGYVDIAGPSYNTQVKNNRVNGILWKWNKYSRWSFGRKSTAISDVSEAGNSSYRSGFVVGYAKSDWRNKKLLIFWA